MTPMSPLTVATGKATPSLQLSSFLVRAWPSQQPLNVLCWEPNQHYGHSGLVPLLLHVQ